MVQRLLQDLQNNPQENRDHPPKKQGEVLINRGKTHKLNHFFFQNNLLQTKATHNSNPGVLQPHQRTHIVEDVCPSLHGDALEDGEHSKEDIVKVGDAVVGPLPVLPAGGPTLTLPGRRLLSARKISHLITCREEQWGEKLPTESSSWCCRILLAPLHERNLHFRLPCATMGM